MKMQKNILTNLSKLLREYYCFIIFALIISFIFGLPHLYIPFLQGGDEYTPLVVYGVNAMTVDETLYASQIREGFDNLFSYDPMSYEHKNDVNFLYWNIFMQIVLGLLTHLTGSVPNTYIVCDFILPPIIFMLVVILLLKMINNKIISIMGGVSVLLLTPLINPISPLSSAFRLVSVIFEDPLRGLYYFDRLPQVQFSFIILILTIILFYISIRNSNYYLGVLSGIFGGLLFYTYVVYPPFFLSSIFIFGLYLLVKREFKQLKITLTCLISSFVISIPFWIKYMEYKSLPFYDDIMAGQGLELSRSPSLWSFALILGFIMLFWYLQKEKKSDFYYLSSFVIGGGIICYNIQVITGYNIMKYHWLGTATTPLFIILIAFMFGQFINDNIKQFNVKKIFAPFKKHYKLICLFFTIFLLLYGVNHQIKYSQNTYEYYKIPPTSTEAFNWLNDNTQKEDVVLGLGKNSYFLIPVYTHNNYYIPNYAFTVGPPSEKWERLLEGYAIYNVSSIYLDELLDADNLFIEYYKDLRRTKIPNQSIFEKAFFNPHLFGQEYYFNKCYLPAKYIYPESVMEIIENEGGCYFIPYEVRAGIMNQYQNKLKENRNSTAIQPKYRLDYIYLGPYEKSIANINLSQYNNVKEVFQNDDVTIYKLIK
jgi:hypothetical protein